MTAHRLHRQAFHPWPRQFIVMACALVWAVAGCTQVPELDATFPTHLNTAAYPKLVGLDGSLATVTVPRDQAAQIEDTLTARAERLKARARALNKPVIDLDTRKRMQNKASQ